MRGAVELGLGVLVGLLLLRTLQGRSSENPPTDRTEDEGSFPPFKTQPPVETSPPDQAQPPVQGPQLETGTTEDDQPKEPGVQPQPFPPGTTEDGPTEQQDPAQPTVTEEPKAPTPNNDNGAQSGNPGDSGGDSGGSTPEEVPRPGGPSNPKPGPLVDDDPNVEGGAGEGEDPTEDGEGGCSAHGGLAYPESLAVDGSDREVSGVEGHMLALECPESVAGTQGDSGKPSGAHWFWDARDFALVAQPVDVSKSFQDFWDMRAFVGAEVDAERGVFRVGPWGEAECAGPRGEVLRNGRLASVEGGRQLLFRWVMPQDQRFLCADTADLSKASKAVAFKLTVRTCQDDVTCNKVESASNQCLYSLPDSPMRKVWCKCAEKYTGPFCATELHKLWFFPLISTGILLYFGAFLAVAAIRPMRLYRVSLEDVGGTEADRLPLFRFLESDAGVLPFRPGMAALDTASSLSEDPDDASAGSHAPAAAAAASPDPVTQQTAAQTTAAPAALTGQGQAPTAPAAVAGPAGLAVGQTRASPGTGVAVGASTAAPLKGPTAKAGTMRGADSKVYTLSRAPTYRDAEDVQLDNIKKAPP